MPSIETFTRDVQFGENVGLDVAQLSFDQKLGYWQIPSLSDLPTTSPMLVGFVNPRMMRDATEQGAFLQPITEYSELPADMQTIDAQGKGVGTRAYNLREAFGGSRERVPAVDVVAFIPRNLLDLRPVQGNRLTQIARHGGRILRSKLVGTERVVEDIHRKYDNAGAVLMYAPPHQEIRSAVHKVEIPDDVRPEFIIIRDALTHLHKIGVTTSPW